MKRILNRFQGCSKLDWAQTSSLWEQTYLACELNESTRHLRFSFLLINHHNCISYYNLLSCTCHATCRDMSLRHDIVVFIFPDIWGKSDMSM
eukprot:scaffold48067_cov25-Cyclotella_meneghiniana.AAC.1